MFDVQASASFPTEALSEDVAVTGGGLFSDGGSLLSNEIPLAGELTRSLLPYLAAFTKLFACNCPQDLSFAGKFVQSCWRPGEEYTDVRTRVHPLTPLQDSIIAQVLFPWKQG